MNLETSTTIFFHAKLNHIFILTMKKKVAKDKKRIVTVKAFFKKKNKNKKLYSLAQLYITLICGKVNSSTFHFEYLFTIFFYTLIRSLNRNNQNLYIIYYDTNNIK